MRGQRCSRIVHFIIVATLVLVFAPAVRADELWVAASSQQDLGGLEIASNAIWPSVSWFRSLTPKYVFAAARMPYD